MRERVKDTSINKEMEGGVERERERDRDKRVNFYFSVEPSQGEKSHTYTMKAIKIIFLKIKLFS